MKEDYWLHREAKQVVDYLEEVHAKWAIWNNSPFRQAWLRNYIAYYSPVIAPGGWDTSLIFEGVQGELVRFYTPKARTYIRQLAGIVTKQRIAVQALCQTDGRQVVEDVKLANALSDQIITNQRLDIKGKSLVEGALVTGSWFTKTVWRTDLGQPYTRDANGTIIFTGGVEISLSSPFNTFYDSSYAHWEQLPWVEVRTAKNRWDLIAQHPDLAKDIMALPSARENKGPHTWFDSTLTDEDRIFVYELYCRPSPSLPRGRMIIYGDSRTVFYDDDNQYNGIPIEPMTPDIVLDTSLGYPQFTNILAAQEMYDNSLSAIATNQSQFAVQSVTTPRGSGINVQEINGMRFVSYTPQNVPGGGKPEALQLTQSSPETFKFADMLDEKIMQQMSGINGALRGIPPAGVTSGVAIATLSANALEFTEDVGLPYRVCLEKTIYHAINAYKLFAKLPQNLEVKGVNNKVSSQQFKGEQLQNVSGIKILTANPLMQTISGRLEIAEKIMAMPKDLWPKYVAILEGRPLTDIYKNDLSQEDLIQSEDEDLMAGTPVMALATDDHAVHIQSHAGLLNDSAVRTNGTAIEGILAHIEEHKMLAQTTDPYLMAMVRTGKTPDMGMMPPPGVPAPGGGPGGPPALAEQEIEPAQPAPDALDRGV